MKKTTVVNLRKEPYDIYIGRGSVYGNPFYIGKDGTRKEVVIKYYKWLIGKIVIPNRKPPSRKDLKKLIGKRLGCFCKPKLCHGDVLIIRLRKLFGINELFLLQI